MQRYIADLRRWLKSQGCAFVDLTNDLEPSEQIYLKNEDDHIRPAAKRQATELYVEKLRPLLR